MTTSLTPLSHATEFGAATMAELVEFCNKHSGKPPIKKFESRTKGVERCIALARAVSDKASTEGAARTAGQPKLSMTPAGELRVKKPTAEKPKAPTSAAEQMARVLTSTAHPSTAKAAPAKKVAAKAAAPKAKVSGGGRAHFTEDAVITIIHKGENPKRGTAADRYDLYRNGMTVAAYIAAGGQRRDVVWDQKMGWIRTAEPK